MSKFKKTIKVLLKILLAIIIIIVMCGVGVFGAITYLNWQQDQKETVDLDGNIVPVEGVELEENVTCLFMGVNGHLTDFIMLGQYNPNTREINLLSIPRDTKVEGTVDGKINSAYSGVDPMRTVNKVADVTGITADYYILFNASILADIVDELGGVVVDVPINMNYDDPAQNLYIHLKKGTQKLTGKQAEQFVRFRKNNDGSGYANADVDRIAAQQQFIKATISTVLQPQNLLKVGKLIDIILEGTKTNITMDVAKNYIDDVATFKSDRIRIETLPGAGGYAANKLSYYFVDEEAAEELIKDMFLEETTVEEVTALQNTETKEIKTDGKNVEVLNAGATTSIFNQVVELLKNNGYTVSKVGNYETNKTEYSRVITYSEKDEALLNIKELLGISKDEKSTDNKDLNFTVIIGPLYELD